MDIPAEGSEVIVSVNTKHATDGEIVDSGTLYINGTDEDHTLVLKKIDGLE